jgi:IS5 family transposase
VDDQTEKEIHDRISFMHFLDYPDLFPDTRTIRLFSERLSKTGKDKIILNELQRQPELKGRFMENAPLEDEISVQN